MSFTVHTTQSFPSHTDEWGPLVIFFLLSPRATAAIRSRPLPRPPPPAAAPPAATLATPVPHGGARPHGRARGGARAQAPVDPLSSRASMASEHEPSTAEL